MVTNDDLNAKLSEALAAQQPPAKDVLASLLPPPNPTPYDAAFDAYDSMWNAADRIRQYADATRYAFDHLKKTSGMEQLNGELLRSGDQGEIGKLLALIAHQEERDFLEQEDKRADALVYAQATVSLWSALESGLDDMIVALLAHDDALLDLKVTNKVEVPLGKFHKMTESQRLRRIARSLKEQSKGQHWGDHYAEILKSLGIGERDTIDDAVKRVLIEFWAVRNCLVHSRGIVDDAFLEQCGLGGYEAGSPIAVTAGDFYTYFSTVLHWPASLLVRIEQHYYPDRPAGERKIVEIARRTLQLLTDYSKNREPDDTPDEAP